MITNFNRRRKKKSNLFVDPDEIFLDSHNLENFDRQQFEGRIEKAISKKTILFLGVFFLITAFTFSARLGYLQIKKGEAYMQRSENNMLGKVIIFSDRGIIYDRNGKEIAWNQKTETTEGQERGLDFPMRKYMTPGFSHLLGYLSYPTKDKSGKYWQTDFIGKEGLEKQYDEYLKGRNGAKIVETDARGGIHSENKVNDPVHGRDLTTTVDSRIQKQLHIFIRDFAGNNSFRGGAGVIMDAWNGEIISAVSFPEYDSAILSRGEDKEEINRYLNDDRKVFLDRTKSGLYTPGSIVKPFFAMAALSEGVIDPYKKILSTGSISIPNPYFPDKPTIFKDWKAHGWVDMRQAIAVSSDIYFYAIGGGFEGQKGVGILNLEKYSKIFGIGEITGVDHQGEKGGVIPSPEWKAKNFKGDPWRVGDTYNTSIGQYGYQVTLLEMTRAVSAIANTGILPAPHFVKDDLAKEAEARRIEKEFSPEIYQVAREGMREVVLSGTATVLRVPYVEVAAKTGTAQVGISKSRVNSWIMGYFPYDNPRYSFTIMMESGPAGGTAAASAVMRQLLDWMNQNTPEYFD
ncbi:MAG TPA: penicillin-binding transpeptidase domain-containing protein [Candidatus Paceibacterota bacterium]|nr:penicillin-binding transpeptidase domain-containing protein [Candidatus Paceibacterota bacterium]